MQNRSDLSLLLKKLSDSCRSFGVIRTPESENIDSLRDIDCVLSKSEMKVFLDVLQKRIIRVEFFRPNAVSLILLIDNLEICLDLHFGLHVRGVKKTASFLHKNSFVMHDGIRILDKSCQVRHSLHISLVQNKGVHSKILSSFVSKKYKETQENAIFKTKVWRIIQKGNDLSQLKYLYSILICYGIFDFFSLVNSIFNQKKRSKKTKTFILLYLSQLPKVLEELDLGLKQSDLCIVHTRDRELRFAFYYPNLSEVFSYISLHSKGAQFKLLISKILATFQLVMFQRVSDHKFSVGNKRRILKSVFFGTPSVDRTLIAKYCRGGRDFIVKHNANKNMNVSEYQNYKFFIEQGLSQFLPKMRLYQCYLIQNFINKKPFNPSSFLQSQSFGNLLKKQRMLAIEKKLDLVLLSLNDYCLSCDIFSEKVQNLLEILKLSGEKQKVNTIKLTWCHGDLTPWNVIYSLDRFVIIDFEKVNISKSVPLGYDCVHFMLSNLVFANKEISVNQLVSLEKVWCQIMNEDNNFVFKLNLVMFLVSYLSIIQTSKVKLVQYTWIQRFLSSKSLVRYISE